MTRTTQIYQSMRCSVTLYLGTNHRTCSSYYFSIEMQDAASVNLVTEAKETALLLFLKFQLCRHVLHAWPEAHRTYKLMVPIWGTRHEVWFPHHDGRQSTMRLYPHLCFPTTMDGKAQWVYTLICISPPWWTEKHNAFIPSSVFPHHDGQQSTMSVHVYCGSVLWLQSLNPIIMQMGQGG